MKRITMMNLQQVVFKQLFVVSICARLNTVVAVESFLVLNVENVNIHFNSNSFNRFYKCLCNTAMANCVATTETSTRPGDHVNVVNIDPVYTGHYTDTSRRRCLIEHHGRSNFHFAINCSATLTQCHHRISLISHYNENNDLCGSTKIEIGWEPDANITNYDSKFIRVQNCKVENITESRVTDRQSMITPSMQESTEYRQVTGEKSPSQPETGSNFSNVVKIVATIGGCILVVFILIAVCVTIVRRKRMLIFKGKYGEEESLEKSDHYHTIDLPRLSETCDSRGFGIQSKPVIQSASASATNDSGYSIIEIVDVYPDNSKQIKSNSSGTDKMDVNNYDTQIEDSDSIKTTDNCLYCSSKQAVTTPKRSLMALPKIPDSNKIVYTEEKCATSSKEHLKKNVYDRIVK